MKYLSCRPKQRGIWVGLLALILWLAACAPTAAPAGSQSVPTLSGIFAEPQYDPTSTRPPIPTPTATQFMTATLTPEPPQEVVVAPAAGVQLTVDVLVDGEPISPYIYGMNWAGQQQIQEMGVTVNRWGGNATTRYNWQNNTSNRASDWFFENIPNDNTPGKTLPDGSASDQFVESNLTAGTETILTIPLIGWTPKSRAISCGFSVEKYGEQQKVDPDLPDCGNGVRPDGALITRNDPYDTSLPIDERFVLLWLRHLTGNFGTAEAGGVRFYNLDNEPMLWHHTHRDAHPEPVSYDEIRERTYQYAPVIKAVDPGAQTLGPVVWGWTAYFNSALDQEESNWLLAPPDQSAHEGLPFIAWYLREMQAYEQQNGLRILDYLDVHYYPQAPGVALSAAGDEATQELRLRSTRSLWDPEYPDESWIGEPVMLIPRLREWVDAYYPDTKLAITEYNFGGLEHINGALAQAEVLGIFGREGLDLATLWSAPGVREPGAFAFRMYRNYDGQGGAFGDLSLPAASPDLDRLSIFAARRTADGALTLMVINKSFETIEAQILLNNELDGTAAVYQYADSNLSEIQALPETAVSAGELDFEFARQSITLIVLKDQ